MNEWMCESIFYNSKLQNQSKLLKDLVVWFSRNLEEWNLSLKLPGGISI